MSKRIPILLGIILIGIASWLLLTPIKSISLLIERLDNMGYDLQLRTRVLTKQSPFISPIAIVDIDDKSLKAEGRWPWSRSKLGKLVDTLNKNGAAVIVFDILFSEEENNIADIVVTKLKENNIAPIVNLTTHRLLFDEDNVLAKSISNIPTVLAFGFLPRDLKQNVLSPPLLTLDKKRKDELNLLNAFGYLSNIPILQQAAKGSGFINAFPDSDGIIRHSPLIMEYGQGIYPSLALQAAMTFLGENIKLITPNYGNIEQLEGIQLGERIIPTDAKGQVYIPFIGRSYTFPYYSATDILNNRIPQDALLGKILFIGTSAIGLGDLLATAIQNPFPGVEIQATLTNGILQNNFSHKPAWMRGANLFITVLFGLTAALLFPFFGPRMLGVIIFALPLCLLILNNWIWIHTGLIFSFLIPVILVLAIAFTNIIYGYLFETRRREKLKAMFGQYVPEKHIDEMLHSKSDYGLRGEDREMSVLFADIRNFTSISEKMSAAELVDMLNTFFTPMTEIIFKHRGTIDKYVGDLIMAFWGAPLKDKYHARHAIQSALEMHTKLKDLNPMLKAKNWPEIKIGISINSGIMSVGDMGSRFRRNYTVLGDEVNLAARIEALTKFYGVDIIVTEQTKSNQTRFVFRTLDRVKVKGKNISVAIYEVICASAHLTTKMIDELAIYHNALNFYFEQEWAEALKLMSQLHEKHPHKKLYRIYIDRIKEYQLTPPPLDWNGVYVHTAK